MQISLIKPAYRVTITTNQITPKVTIASNAPVTHPVVISTGVSGESAYALAVRVAGFEGTESEWLESLRGINSSLIRRSVEISPRVFLIGHAVEGTEESDANWLIEKKGFNDPFTLEYPNGDDSFSFVWNDALSYTYASP